MLSISHSRLTAVYNGSLPAGTTPNVIKIDDAGFVFVSFYVTPNAPTVTQRIYDYYQCRYQQKTKLFAQPAKPGDSVLIATQSNRQIKGIIERMETDLAGGMVQQVEIIGSLVPL